MKFKDFINEKYINNNKEYAFLLLGRMPIAPKLWSRISKIKEIKNAYHVTDEKNIKNIYKIQGTKKQISTFTKGDTTVAMGIDTAGGVLFELSGQSTLAIDGDAWTSLDRNGMRWWDLGEMSNRDLPKLDGLKMDIMGISQNVLRSDEFKDLMSDSKFNNSTTSQLIKFVEKTFSGKQKARFIKLALDAVEKYLKTVDLKMIMKLADSQASKYFGGTAYFNEIVLHNIKVKHIYGIIPYDTNKQIKIREMLLDGSFSHEYDGWIERHEIEDIDNTKPRILSAEVAFGI
jgi:hypothetical protein